MKSFGPSSEERSLWSAATASLRQQVLGFYELAFVGLLALFFCVVVAESYGQDINWDLLNYHAYVSYAFWNDRLDVDVAPAQLQTWFNPLASILQFGVIETFSPRVAAGLFAALSSISIVLIYALSVLSLSHERRLNPSGRIMIAALACIGAFSSPMFRSELGTTFADVLGGSLVLAALVCLFGNDFRLRGYVLGGLFLGVAVGLKLTNAFYFCGWIAALLVVEQRNSLRPIFLTSLCAFAAYIPTGGLWAVHLAIETGNPLFPAYNHLFKSLLYPPLPMLDHRFRIDGFADGLRYLYEWPLGKHPSAEVVFVDIRFTLLIALLVIVGSVSLFVWLRNEGKDEPARTVTHFDPRCQRFLTMFVAVAFVVWIKLFGIQRYAVGLEQIAPLLIIMLLSRLIPGRWAFAVGAAVAVATIAIISQRADWGRATFTSDWFEVRVPSALEGGGVLFVMLTGAPMSYVIPYLSETDRFVRIEGNMPIAPETGLGARVADNIAAHTGPIRTLSPADAPLEESAGSLAAYGLIVDLSECVDIGTKAGLLQSCRLRRIVK
jgi:hypothetical protein